jgi:PKD repeat protein
MKKTLLLILTILIYSQISKADNYNWTGDDGDGNWNNEQNWFNTTSSSINGFPSTAVDNANIASTIDDIELNGNITLNNLTISGTFGGTFVANTYNITVVDFFVDVVCDIDFGTGTITATKLTIQNAIVNSSSSVLRIVNEINLVTGQLNFPTGSSCVLGRDNNDSPIIVKGNINFRNLTLNAFVTSSSGSRAFTITDNINVLGDLILFPGGGSRRIVFINTSAIIFLRGDLIYSSTSSSAISPHNAPSHSTIITLNGAGNQTINASGVAAGTRRLSNIFIDKPSGDVNFIGNIYLHNDLNIINCGGSVNFGSSVIWIRRNLTINPSITLNSGTNTIRMEETGIISNLNIGGKKLFNLQIVSATNLLSALDIDNEITFANTGAITFNLNSHNLRLLSTASKTARIGAIPTDVTISNASNFMQQRFIPGGSTGWAFFGTPTNGSTLQTINNGMTTSGFPGSDFPSHNFTSIYHFNESLPNSITDGYVAPTNITNTMVNGRGYYVYTGTSQSTTTDLMVTFAGTPNRNSISLPVTYTTPNNIDANDNGWNLVANPYPSPISWSALTKFNIADEIHVYNADLNGGDGGFATYIGGVSNPAIGAGGIGNVIPACQGFFVKATGNAPTLTAQEAHKSSTLTQAFLNTVNPNGNNLLRFALTNSSNKRSETVLRFHQEGSLNYDESYDANKMFSSNQNTPELYSIIDDRKYAINSLPDLDTALSIALELKALNGSYTLSAFNLSEFNKSSCLTLEDLKTGDIIDLRSQNTHSFTFSNSDVQPRFIVHVGEQTKFEAETEEITCFNADDAEIKFTPISTGAYNLYYTDNNNDTIRQILNTSVADIVTGLSEGFYTLSVQKIGACGTSDILEFNIQNPLENISSNVVIPATCFDANDGEVVLELENNGPWNVVWTDANANVIKTSTNINTFDTLVAPRGNYFANIEFSNNCGNITENIFIGSPEENNGNITLINNDICYDSKEGGVKISGITNYPAIVRVYKNNMIVANKATNSDSLIFNDLPGGNLEIHIYHDNNCGNTVETVFINESDDVLVDFTPSAYNVEINNTVSFTNMSVGTNEYTWDFGDGNTSNLENPTHAFTSVGNYEVTLTARDSICDLIDAYSHTIVVEDPSSSRTVEQDDKVKFIDNNNGFFVDLNLNGNENTIISAYNIAGQKVISDILTKQNVGRIKLDLPLNENNIFIVRVITSENIYQYKTFK